jgi:hypothetical protein
VQDNPVEGEIDDVRVTLPVNPLTGLIVRVEVVVEPARALVPVGLAAMVKSVTVNETVVE